MRRGKQEDTRDMKIQWRNLRMRKPLGLLVAIIIFDLPAMAQEKAVVATSVGGTQEALADTGILIPPGNRVGHDVRLPRRNQNA